VCTGGTATPWVAAALRSWLSKAWGDSENRRALLTWPGWPQLARATKGTTLAAQPLLTVLGAAPPTTCCAALGDKKKRQELPSSLKLLSLHFRSQE